MSDAAGKIGIFVITALALAYILWDIRKAERNERAIREALDVANGKPKGPEDDDAWLNSLRDDSDG